MDAGGCTGSLEHGRMAVRAIDDTTLHDEGGVPQSVRLRNRIPWYRNDIGEAARLDGADLVGAAQELGGVARGGQYRIDGLHAVRDQQCELHGVIAFPDVSAIGDLDTRLNGEWQVLLGKQIIGELFGCRARCKQLRVVARGGIEKVVY